MHHPFASGLIVLNTYPIKKAQTNSVFVKLAAYAPCIVSDDMGPYCLDCLAVSIYPSNSVSLEQEIFNH